MNATPSYTDLGFSRKLLIIMPNTMPNTAPPIIGNSEPNQFAKRAIIKANKIQIRYFYLIIKKKFGIEKSNFPFCIGKYLSSGINIVLSYN